MFKEMTIEELGLSFKTYNGLKRAGINTVCELVSKMHGNFGYVFKINNLGKFCIEDLLKKLQSVDFPFFEELGVYLSIDESWKDLYHSLSLQFVQKKRERIQSSINNSCIELPINRLLIDECYSSSDAFYDLSELRTVGISSATDLPIGITPSEFGKMVDDWYRSSKLSDDACEQLISLFKRAGYDIPRSKQVCPDVALLPQTFQNPEEDDDIEHQQIRNYVRALYSGNADIQLAEMNSAAESSIYYVETGILFVNPKTNQASFVGNRTERISTSDSFPFNLIAAICGDGQWYCVNSDIKECVSERVDSMLSTLTPREERIIRAHYQYGQNKAALDLLPQWPTIQWGLDEVLNKPLRKLRHPSRSRGLGRCIEGNPCMILPFKYEGIYKEFVDVIITRIREKAESGCSLRSALSEYYNDKVVDAIEKRKSEWVHTKPLSISEMNLPWEIYAPLEQARIKTLSDLWNRHGKGIPLGDCIHSGLRTIYGLHEDGLNALFSIMKENQAEEIDAKVVPEIVQYAEELACNNIRTDDLSSGTICPNIACVAVPTDMFRFWLDWGIRNRAEVVQSYESGKLIAMYTESNDLSFSWEDMEKVVHSLQSGKFSMQLIVNADFWDTVFEQNPGISFQDIRNRYLSGEPLGGNVQEMEKHIGTLFPPNCISYKLLSKTRDRSVHWVKWPLTLIERSGIIPYELEDAYISLSHYERYDRYLFIRFKANDGFSNRVYSFNYGKGMQAIKEIVEVDLQMDVAENIFRSVLINAEMFSDPKFDLRSMEGRSLKQDIATLYVAVQKQFCSYFAARTENVEERRFFDSFQERKMKDALIPWLYKHSYSKLSLYDEVTTLEELDLSVRTFNCLGRHGCRTLGDLLSMKRSDFMKVRGLNEKCLEEIERKLNSLGFTIEGDSEQA